MNNVIKILKQMEFIPGATVDKNFLQGQDAIIKQFNLFSQYGDYDEQFCISFSKDVKARIANMIINTSPNMIPDEYIFFLEYCGGVSIEDDDFYFSTYGIGPLVEDYYSSIDSDFAMPDFLGPKGLLKVGHINFRRGILKDHDVHFILDLVSQVQKNCVLGIGPSGLEALSTMTIIEEQNSYKNKWKLVAESFVGWLEMVVETRGAFGYLE